VKELDDRGGKATVIAAIEKTVQTADGKPQQSYQRISASLTRTKDGWKLDNLGPVPYAQPR
jgi:Mce-associated membrane protein